MKMRESLAHCAVAVSSTPDVQTEWPDDRTRPFAANTVHGGHQLRALLSLAALPAARRARSSATRFSALPWLKCSHTESVTPPTNVKSRSRGVPTSAVINDARPSCFESGTVGRIDACACGLHCGYRGCALPVLNPGCLPCAGPVLCTRSYSRRLRTSPRTS